MKKLRKIHQKGFTLIELLVVVAIIGLLSSVVLISLNTARAKARDAKRLADIRQMASAFELYFNDCGSYPILAATTLNNTFQLQAGSGTAVTSTAPCGANDGTAASPNGNGGIRTASGGTGTVYLGQFPAAPTPQDGSCTSANNPYIYTAAGSGGVASTYSVAFCLGAQTGGYGAGTHTLSPGGIN